MIAAAAAFVIAVFAFMLGCRFERRCKLRGCRYCSRRLASLADLVFGVCDPCWQKRSQVVPNPDPTGCSSGTLAIKAYAVPALVEAARISARTHAAASLADPELEKRLPAARQQVASLYAESPADHA